MRAGLVVSSQGIRVQDDRAARTLARNSPNWNMVTPTVVEYFVSDSD